MYNLYAFAILVIHDLDFKVITSLSRIFVIAKTAVMTEATSVHVTILNSAYKNLKSLPRGFMSLCLWPPEGLRNMWSYLSSDISSGFVTIFSCIDKNNGT